MGQSGEAKKALDASIRIYEFCNLPDKLCNSKTAIKLDKFEGNIEFKNVAFKYPTRKNWVFRDLNMTIKKGEKIV